jgi:starvation-inducible DNA-binding protein
MSKIIDNLKLLLAENYALYLKTQSYHWNVTGHNFSSLHSLFEKQYGDLAEANDLIAERIRALNEKVHVSFTAFNSAKKASDPKADDDSNVMIKDLIKDHEYLKTLLAELANVSSSKGDKATEDLAIERTRHHEKQIWILKSSL